MLDKQACANKNAHLEPFCGRGQLAEPVRVQWPTQQLALVHQVEGKCQERCALQ